MKRFVGSKLSVVLAAIATAFLSGVLAGSVQLLRPMAVFAVASLAQAFCLFLWYRIDAGQRGFRRSYALNVAVAGFALVGVPYYLFRTRGFLGGTGAIAILILIFLLTGVLPYLGAFAVHQLGRH